MGTVRESIGSCFSGAVLWNDGAEPHLDKEVVREHSYFDDDDYLSWPGTHKHVVYWVETEDGVAVGFNEAPTGFTTPQVYLKNVVYMFCENCDWHKLQNSVKCLNGSWYDDFEQYLDSHRCPECEGELQYKDYPEEYHSE